MVDADDRHYIENAWWWHSLQLDDIITNGKKSIETIETEATRWGMNEDLFKGKDVLDIGAWDGAYSFKAEGYGASYVLAIDGFVWRLPITLNKPSKKQFDLAKKILKSNVDSKILEVYEIDTLDRKFDVVIFAGVFYHLQHPFLALQKISRVLHTGGKVVFESQIFDSHYSTMNFFPDGFNNDNTNWWIPTQKCLLDLFRVCGFIVLQSFIDNGRYSAILYKFTELSEEHPLHLWS